MKRFTIRLYSDFGMVPQDETRILFESDSLMDVKTFINDYFEYESYFNAVYFVDNKLKKSDYVGRDLTIACDETLEAFCEMQDELPANNDEIRCLEAFLIPTMNGLEKVVRYADIEKELKEKDELAQALSIVTCENGELLKYKKALEIIKNANLNVVYYGFIDGKDVYALRIGEREIKYIQREEYDLLKEVLL